MPGITLSCILNKKIIKENSGAGYEEFLNALNSAIHNDSYKSEILLREGTYLIGCTRYPEYPVKIFESSDYWVYVEGKIYDKQDLDHEIKELMNYIFGKSSTPCGDKKSIAKWLLKTDGDFIICALNKKTGDLVILNDVLGRLPLYYYWKDEIGFIVSRELPIILELIQDDLANTDKLDRMGIAQFLLLGYPLGKRTLLRNIHRLGPANILRISNNSVIRIDNIYLFNFESKIYPNQSIEKNAQELVLLFSKACKDRADFDAKNIICLSGGFDSRCVLACFHKNKIPGYAVTYLEPGWTSLVGDTSDAEIAEQLAKSLDFEWWNFDFEQPRAKDVIKLLTIKNALPYLAYSFLLPFLDKLKHKQVNKHNLSKNRIFTGLGGEIIRQYTFPREIRELSGLVNSIIGEHHSFSLSEVANLVQLEESEIVDEIRNIISSYPEESMNKKFMHYVYYEVGAKHTFESEDIIRFYFWTASPFFSIPFFNYVINCPDKYKSKDALYRKFLDLLSPSATAVSISSWGCAIISNKYKILQLILSLMWKFPNLSKILQFILSVQRMPIFTKSRVKKDNRTYKDNSKIICCMREQLNNCHYISNYLSRNGIEEILNKYGSYRHVAIHNLFAVMLLIENSFCNNTTIGKYYDN